ncbi:MAG: hypothetical protein HKN54_04570 [Flavobacteriaceae bacterium]|nr:hypothetical protein [Flavobacteriaceae bacterium]
MQKIAIIIAIFVSGLLNAQGNYENGMMKAFELWQANNMSEAGHLFERIAEAEEGNWLPKYYAAHVSILSSFGETDESKLSARLEKAQNLLNDAMTYSPENPEIMVLQALLYTAWISYDGAKYGMTLSGKVYATYAKAQTMAPTNPRVVLAKAEWEMGSASYFGQDTKPFCKDVERSLDLFANFKPESEFHPKWGKERAEQILSNCN